jgi:mono/diheme cytochrome c family protein
MTVRTDLRISAVRARRLAVMALTVLGLLVSCTGRPTDEATGEEIYLQLCANCHAEDLGGGIGPALGPGSNSAERPDDFLEVAILNGRGSMPSFSSSLDTEQLNRLIAYLREVQRQ